MTAIVWTGSAGDGNFNNPANWNPQQVPGASDTVTINAAAATAITASNAAVADLTTSKFITLTVANNNNFSIGTGTTATFSNGGTFGIASAGNGTGLIVGATSLTLTGGGTVLLTDNANNAIAAAAAGDTLDNVNNLIEGGGIIGNGGLALINAAGGTVDATGANSALTITAATSNAGLLEATGPAGLVLKSAVTQTTGTVSAAGGNVYLQGGTIAGGTLASNGGAAIIDNGGGTLNGVTITGTVAVANNNGLTLLGTITDNGQIELNSTGNATNLVIGPGAKPAGTVTLAGTGQLVLGDNANNHIVGGLAGDRLINLSETISGGGSFNGPLTFTNNATVNANAAAALVFNAGVAVTNTKLMESTLAGGGGLVISTTVAQSGAGTIAAVAGNVYLNGGAISGGRLTTGTGGIFVSNGTLTNLLNAGVVTVDNNTSLTVSGTINNAGTIALASVGNGTFLDAAGATTTLTGAGTILLSNNGNNIIGAVTAGNVLNNVSNIIEGGGAIQGGVVLVNGAKGIIDATQPNALTLNTGTAVVSNAGLLEATTGALVIDCAIASTGTIAAKTGNVYLQNGGRIAGGTIITSGGGQLIENGGASIGGTLDGSAAAVTNLGTVVLANNSSLQLLGAITNTGTIDIASGGNGTALVIGPTSGSAGTVTLSGAGTVTTTDNANNLFVAGQAGDTLVNDQAIAGAGSILSPLTLINNGTIDATLGNALTINAGVTVTNNALLEATNATGGGLVLQAVINDTNHGTVLSAGGTVSLNGGTIEGGLIASSGGGMIVASAGAVLDGSAQAVTNTGTVIVANNNALNVIGTIANQGTLELASVGNGTGLIIDSATVTLSGGGTVLLTDNGNNYVTAATAGNVLDNVNNVIEGSGQLGDGTLTLVNASAGVIDASGASQLVVNTGAAAVQNSGLMESTGTGGLLIYDTTIADGTAGKLGANGGNIYLQGATIQGGTLSASSTFSTVVQATSLLDGSHNAIVNDATVNIANNVALNVLGTIDNVGTIALDSGGNGTELIIGSGAAAATVKLTGKGAVVLSDNVNNLIVGASAGGTLINLNNTIEGAGYIGGAALTLINDATINATSATNTLQLNFASTLVNNSLIEATGAGGLTVDGTTISDGAKGKLTANGGAITLNSSTIQGGTLNGASGFYINSNTVLDGTVNTVINDATVNVDDNNALILLGTITNAGTIALNSVGNGTYLNIGPGGSAGTVTLTGKGTVLLSDNVNNLIVGASGGGTLVNLNNTIEGAGYIGGAALTLINDATINATSATNTLQLNFASTLVNNSLIEATGAGGLSIVNTTINNGTTGTISANGGGVTLNGATIDGGVLSGASGFAAVNGSVLDGTTHILTNDATVTVVNNQAMTLAGTIDNVGAIDVASGGNGTALDFSGATVTLTGGGTIALSDNGNNSLVGGATTVLDNVNNLIEGAGNLGAGQLALIDGGIIAATGANALLLDVGSTGTITASGALLGIGAGGLTIENGAYTNLGLIEAEDGSSVTFLSSGVLTNLANGTLTGGVYAAVDSGHGATLNFAQSIVTDAADIVLSGANAAINGGGNAIESTLQAITTAGTLALLGGINYADTANGGVFDDAGQLILTGGTFTGTKLTIDQGATLSGFGTLATNVVNNGTIAVVGGHFTFGGSVTGTGTMTTGAGGILEFVGGGTLGSGVSGTGTLELGLGSFTLGSTAPTIANLQVDAHASLSGAGTLTSTISDQGALAAAGGTLTLAGALGGSGTLSANAGAELAIAGGGSFAGALSGGGTVLIGSAITLNQGASLSAAAVVDTAQLTLGANVNLANGAGSVLTLSATGVPGSITPHRTQIAITGVAGDSISNAGTLVASGAGEEIIGVAFNNTGLVNVTGGVLRFGGAMSGGGTMTVASGGLLLFAGGGSFGGALTGAGTVQFTAVTTLNAGASLAAGKMVEDNNLKLAAGESITNQAGKIFVLNAAAPAGVVPHRTQIELSGTVGDTFTNLGSVLANGGGTEQISVAFVNAGHVSATAGTLSFLRAVSGAGHLDVSTGAVIDLIGTATLAGAMTGAGTLRFDNAVTLQAGASIAVANVVETDNLTLGARESLTNLAGDVYTLTTGTTAAGNPPHRTQIALTGATGDIFTNAGSLAVNGTGSATFSLAVVNSGATTVGSGTLSFLGAVTNTGTMTATGATAIFGTAVGGAGTLDVGASGTISLLAGAASGQVLDFLTTSGLVDLTAPTSFAGTIGGFGTGNAIDLINTAETSYKFSGGVLTVKNGTAVVANLHFSGAYTTGSFTLGSDTHGGTMITFA